MKISFLIEHWSKHRQMVPFTAADDAHRLVRPDNYEILKFISDISDGAKQEFWKEIDLLVARRHPHLGHEHYKNMYLCDKLQSIHDVADMKTIRDRFAPLAFNLRKKEFEELNSDDREEIEWGLMEEADDPKHWGLFLPEALNAATPDLGPL